MNQSKVGRWSLGVNSHSHALTPLFSAAKSMTAPVFSQRRSPDMIPASFFDINVHHSECLHAVVRHASLIDKERSNYCRHKLTWLVFWPRGILSCSATFTKSRIQEQGEMNAQNEPDRMIMVV
jgi:hypothetical protein